jgi:hypothetical protein
MATMPSDIVRTPAASRGKLPAAVAVVMSEPRPGAIRVSPR